MKEINNLPIQPVKSSTQASIKQIPIKVDATARPNVVPEAKQIVTKVSADGQQLPALRKFVANLTNKTLVALKAVTHQPEPPVAGPPSQKHVLKTTSKRPDTSSSLFTMRLFDAERDLPIVYNENYNISAIGMERLHQFDTQKYGKIAKCLSTEFLDTQFARTGPSNHDEGQEEERHERRLHYLSPNRAIRRAELQIHHSAEFIRRIHEDKSLIARITELWALNLVPMTTIESRLLTPLKWQVAGTIFATYLAMQHGWAINLGGGFHRCSANQGQTFCLFSDIFVAIKHIWQRHPLQKFMIIDLDAHQGTGVERDIAQLDPRKRQMVFMLDMFNSEIHPPDKRADKGVDIRVELSKFTDDEVYLKKLAESMASAFEKFKPTMMIYVAGQDVLLEDQLGLMNITEAGLKRRDELVFSNATQRGCPIVMLLGGGYLSRGAEVQVDSIKNLFAKGLIWGGYRSGMRSLSRPRPGQVTETSLNLDGAGKSSHSQTSLMVTPLQARKVAETIKTAPVEAKYLAKKASASGASNNEQRKGT